VMCRDNNLPLQVFNLHNGGDLMRIVNGEDVGTVVVHLSQTRIRVGVLHAR
jgi:uridylate kinase